MTENVANFLKKKQGEQIIPVHATDIWSEITSAVRHFRKYFEATPWCSSLVREPKIYYIHVFIHYKMKITVSDVYCIELQGTVCFLQNYNNKVENLTQKLTLAVSRASRLWHSPTLDANGQKAQHLSSRCQQLIHRSCNAQDFGGWLYIRLRHWLF